MDEFQAAHRPAMRQFREDLGRRLPEATYIEFLAGDHDAAGPKRVIRLGVSDPASRAPGGEGLTPVMARLGPTDLETLDLLITAGIATSRAEGVRWALARIRERPAYISLLERTREIEALKSQF